MSEEGCDTPAGARRGGVSTLVLGSIWLPFLIFPALALVHAHISATHRVLALAGAGTFVVIYCAVVAKPERVARTPGALAVSVLLIALAVALTTLDRDEWASLFIYAAAAGALVLPARAAAVHVLAATALAAGLTAAEGAGSSVVLSVAVGSAGIGYLVIAVGQLRARNFELARARTELAELAVATERERFARDLHDLLGHSLSVISLKAQLARRLLASAPAEAGTHIADLEQVAREALTEVREAVSGYRQPTLEAALAAARLALEAASIDAHIDIAPAELAPQTEGVLAWAVREGTTNVIRHSGSRNCWIHLGCGESVAALEILDDGHRAGDGGAAAGGTGLRGLRERAAALAGAVESGARAEGGYRLAVVLPRNGR
jgi:two-component system sensor histidine kinase DesK